VPSVHKVRKGSTLVMMVFLELKELKGFRVHKERFRDIRELKVPKEPQVTSVHLVELKVHLV
jgi:hypothetical protein